MKKNITILSIAVLVIVTATFMSCSKKTVSGTPPQMTAAVGTAAYSSPFCLAVRSGSQLMIEGLGGTSTTPTYPYIQVVINQWPGTVGTYPFMPTSIYPGGYGAYYSDPSYGSISDTGAVIITSVAGDLITGGFAFNCSDGVVVSSGAFIARLTTK
jgi:hypothetical protein